MTQDAENLPLRLKCGIIKAKQSDTERYPQKIAALKAIARKAGTGSDRFTARCGELKSAILSFSGFDPRAELKHPIDVRAMTYLLSTDPECAGFVVIDDEFLSALCAPRNPMSRVSLGQLIRAYFQFFDELPGDIKSISQFICDQLSFFGADREGKSLSALVTHRKLLFSANGPLSVLRFTKECELDLASAKNLLGISIYRGGRFDSVLSYYYYLQTARSIEIGANHEILTEIRDPSVLRAHYRGGLLGVELLSILIDRSMADTSGLSPVWRAVILSIAGDPRVSKTSEQYLTWWRSLGEVRERFFGGCLSNVDVEFFLNVLEESAREKGQDEVLQNFPARKEFLVSLMKSGLVVNTRLFLSTTAEQYVVSNFKPEERPEYVCVYSLKTSSIYLNLRDKVHVVEGTHQFRLSLYDKLPKQPDILSQRINYISDGELRTGLKKGYEREFGHSRGVRQYTHRGQAWRGRAEEQIRIMLQKAQERT